MNTTADSKQQTETNYEFVEHENFVERLRENAIRKRILVIEVIAIGLNLTCFILSAYFSIEYFTVSALAVSIDSFLDVIAHSIVLWRYNKPQSLNSRNRDTRASILLALIFFISSSLIEFESIRNLVSRTKPTPSFFLIIACLCQSLAFNTLAIYTFFLAQRVKKNSTIISSGVNSLMSGLGNLSLGISMTLLIVYPRIWYFDSIFGLISGIMVFIYACQLFVMNTCFLNN